MVETRQRRSTLTLQRAAAQRAREPISEAVRAEHLAITKEIADEIVRTQDGLGGGYGCRMAIIRKYSHIYSWLNKHQIDWHVKETRKRNMKTSSTSNNNCNLATISNASNVTNDNLVVNNSTVNSFSVNDTSTMMVSNPILSQVDCCGGGGHTRFGCTPAWTALSIQA